MLKGRQIEHRRLRAPKEHGEALIDPPPMHVAELLNRNETRRRSSEYDFSGRSLAQLIASARQEIIQEARRYTAEYREVDATEPGQDRIFLAGHQPELFHPGVWFKNFALGRLADAHGAKAVNLVIDSDTIKTTAIRVPSGTADCPVSESIAFDRTAVEIPYEQRTILDADQFASFGRRVEDTIAPFVSDPLIRSLWPHAVQRSLAGATLAECLAQSRHGLEGDWGLNTLELPQSRVCQLEAFHWFSAHLLAELPRFWEIHNHVLLEYRAANRIRSKAHPVPNLGSEDSWLEAPFWVWQDANPIRRALFIRQQDDQLLLTDREQLEISLALTSGGTADRAVNQLAGLERQGIKLRTRALATTMFARLILGDLFIHGIGGAKYDEITDAIIDAFFQIEPPEFLTISATVRLPIALNDVPPDAVSRINQQLRELIYHPECYLKIEQIPVQHLETVREAMATKSRWIAAPKTAHNAQLRHFEITRANSTLQPWLEAQRRQIIAQGDRVERQSRIDALLGSRTFPFCLHSEKSLQNLILELLATRL